MNNEQLENCLRNLKSSSREPDTFDGSLEEKMMDLHASIRTKRRRAKHLAAALALALVFGTGFVALGGDNAVMNFIAPSTEVDAEGNPIPYDFNWGQWLHKAHDHLWEHFHHGMHGNGNS